MDLTVLETPGTYARQCLLLRREREGILFSGDTLFFDGVGRSDLPGGSEKKLRESIQKKIASSLPRRGYFPGTARSRPSNARRRRTRSCARRGSRRLRHP